MWQNDQQDFDLLDIITMLSLAMQVAADTQSQKMQRQLDRIEQKLDQLLSKNGEW